MNLTPAVAERGRATKRSGQNALYRLWLERYIATGAANASQALRDVVGPKGIARARVRASQFLQRAKRLGHIQDRIAQVKKAMGVDEILERLSAQARAEDPATSGLTEIAAKADMGEFMSTQVLTTEGKAGEPPTVESRLALDLEAAKAKGLLKFVRKLTPNLYGTSIEIENRADALKAVASIQKSALDTLAKIHGLSDKPPDDRPSLAAMAALLAMIPPDVRVRIHRAEVLRLRGAPVDIEAEEVD